MHRLGATLDRSRDATILSGLDAMTIPLLHRLASAGSASRIVVIEPDGRHPLLDEASGTGARIVVADPMSADVLLPLLSGLRGPQLRYLYALRPQAGENEAVLRAAKSVLSQIGPRSDKPPHLIARIDDPRHADLWRGQRVGASPLWFEDAVSPPESTASALADQIFRTRARRLLLCGDSTVALAILLELAHRAWERQDLLEAAAIGQAGDPASGPLDEAGRNAPNAHPISHILLLDRRAGALRREYLATSPQSIVAVLPAVGTRAESWRDQLLTCLDGMEAAESAETAVVIADAPTDAGMHEAGRVARLHPGIPVFVLSSDGASVTGAAFDQLQPFQRTLLVHDGPPEDSWTRIARHWHECYRLAHPAVPGGGKEPTRRPWADLDKFFRDDSVLQLRSIMAAVAALGRRWVPVRAVVPGSFVELSDGDLLTVARAEHSRWSERRQKAGWRPADGDEEDDDNALVNRNVRPWDDLPAKTRDSKAADVRSQVAQLETVGFMPILPDNGPDGAASFRRIGEVRAQRLTSGLPWRRASGEEMSGAAGDWHVLDDTGDERTVRDPEFLATHEPLGDQRWRRTGTFRAWQVSETVALRTTEGRAVACPGDWVVQGPSGVRWPVTPEQFARSYRPE